METYLVGGAVRDELLGLPVRERDWVVVGARPEDLVARGYRQVGRDFPVFLHPETQEEHALARVERKTAPGYRGFAVQFSPEVTLEEDLQRRDLTINAMARDEHGRLVDPYGGQADLERRLLRHVSAAFTEDPVRVLRLARFAARFAPLGFSVAPETQRLLRQMVESGEVSALVPERTWQETVRALGEARPDVFFTTLRDCGALEVVFPELAKLWGVPQPARWHPEIDTGVHIMMVLRIAAERTPSARIRFAALTHDLGKGETPMERWPAHHGHEERSVRLVEAMADRLRIPNDFRELAHMTARYHGLSHRALELRPSTLLELLEHLDAFRRPERFAEFLVACECDLRGRAGFESRRYPQAEFLQLALATAAAVVLTPEDKSRYQGPALGEHLRDKRIAVLATLVNEQRPQFIAAK